MSDNADDSLDFLVRIKSDTTGAEEGKKAIAGVKVEGHELHRVFHALNEIVPGLGSLMQVAFLPVGAAISVAVLAIRAFHEHTKKLNEEFKRFEEDAAKPLTNRLEIMREGVIRSAAIMVEYKEKLAEAARPHQTLADSIERVVRTMRDENKVVGELAGIGNKAELEALDSLHKAGLVSEQQYAAMRLKIEEEFADKKRKLAEDELQAEINVRHVGLEAAQKDQQGKEGAAAQARVKSEAAETESLVAKSGMDTSKEKSKTTAEALKQYEQSLSPKVKELFERFGTGLTGAQVMGNAWDIVGAGWNLPIGFGQAAYDKWDLLKRSASGAKDDLEKEPSKVAKAETAATTAADAYHRKLDEAADNAKLIAKSGQEITEKEAELATRKKADAEISKAEHGADSLKTPMGQIATGDVAQAVAMAQAEAASKKTGVRPSQDAERQLIDVATRISGHNVSLSQAVAMMEKAANRMRFGEPARVADGEPDEAILTPV
jgi:hypothetical protein